jgi:hypothetical protein
MFYANIGSFRKPVTIGVEEIFVERGPILVGVAPARRSDCA